MTYMFFRYIIVGFFRHIIITIIVFKKDINLKIKISAVNFTSGSLGQIRLPLVRLNEKKIYFDPFLAIKFANFFILETIRIIFTFFTFEKFH